ncbi:hypothetical protein [Pseudozobellia thermophila]|nr:hypothetical protein [Pseudozobellia thermophila]
MKKTIVLVVLFVLPIVAYLFFASGVNNFGKLPVLTEGISDLTAYKEGVSLKDKITVLGFLGYDLDGKKGNSFNLNEKIYKRFYEFKDFQLVMVLPEGEEQRVPEIRKELGKYSDMSKWKFVFMDERSIASFFSSLGTNIDLDENLSTPYVFIVDKEIRLRGRLDDEDEGTKYGYDTSSVAELNNKMVDDTKIILAEYRMALKKNSADR